jgi:hypothetical protein
LWPVSLSLLLQQSSFSWVWLASPGRLVSPRSSLRRCSPGWKRRTLQWASRLVDGARAVALGTVFGGAIFLLCAALGLGALIAPLHVRLPRGVVGLLPVAAVIAGLPVLFPATPRWTGAVLLAAFAGAIA